MKYDTHTLETVKKVQLLALLEVVRICNKYNIKYTPIGGTLLGTIRHNGFIPWDDDIDIGMLREEYNKFLVAAKSELKSCFYLQVAETDPNYAKAMARICVNDTRLIFTKMENVNIHQGVFIDIFPYDNSPDNKISQIKHKYLIKLLKIVTYHKYHFGGYKSHISKVVVSILSLPFIFLSREKTMLLDERVMQKYNNKKTKYVVRSNSKYTYEKVRIEKSLMDENISMPFEGYPISVMKGYHEHLTANYGDYMKLPPKEKRPNMQKLVIEIDLGPYKNESYLINKLNEYKK